MMDEKASEGMTDDAKVIQVSQVYRTEAKQAKQERMRLNQMNFDAYLGKADFSHKKAGQSKEFLPRQPLAVEQITSFLEQAMVDTSPWFSVETEPGVDKDLLKIKPSEMQKLLQRQFDKIHFETIVGDGIKMGCLGALIIGKVHGEYIPRPTFKVDTKIGADGKTEKSLVRYEKLVWQLKVDLVRQEDFYIDPSTRRLYMFEDIEEDFFRVKELSQEGPNGSKPLYDKDAVAALATSFADTDQDAKKARETNQNSVIPTRRRVKLSEYYGTIVDPATGEALYKNVTWTIANDQHLISKPKPIPFWHGQHPYVLSGIVRTPKSEWPKALMDGPTALNSALNELFNLMLDSGIMAVFGIRQLRPSWLLDETKIAEGVPPGETLEVNDTCPPDGKVMETLHTAQMAPEAIQLFNLLSGEFQQSALTNDLRMGQLPDRAVKATEVVEASQTLTSMFSGIAKMVESNFCLEIVKKAWMTCAQNMNDLDDKEVEAMLGKERATEILAMAPEDRFASTVQGMLFKVFGISQTLSKMKDFRKYATVMQTIGGSEVMLEQFTQKYDFGRFLEEILRSLDVDTSRIALTDAEKASMIMQQQEGGGPMAGAAGGPNTGSQQPQAMAQSRSSAPGGPQPNQGAGGGGAIPQGKFPPSRATPKGMTNA